MPGSGRDDAPPERGVGWFWRRGYRQLFVLPHDPLELPHAKAQCFLSPYGVQPKLFQLPLCRTHTSTVTPALTPADVRLIHDEEDVK